MSRSSRDWDRSFNDRPARSTFGVGVIAILIVLGLSAIGGAGFFLLNLAAQPAAVITKTFNADNMIYNYEWFKRQYEDILAADTRIVTVQTGIDTFIASAGDRSTWKTNDRAYFNQLSSQLTGLNNQRTNMVAEYNARANMMNRSIFLAGSPPAL